MLYDNSFIAIYILIVSTVLGAVFGSFINCMAYRIAYGESVIKGRSHCISCNHVLKAPDLIPIFSYVFLRGRCRYCKERISPQNLCAELIMATCFATVVAKYEISPMSLRYLVLMCILLGLSLVDVEKYEIPNRFIIAGIVWWAATVPLMPQSIVEQLQSGLTAAIVIGGGMFVLSLLFDKITGKESLGGGDIKLFFMAGLYLGLMQSLFNLLVACVIGILFVVFMKKKKIPFAPAISLAVFVTVMVGDEIVSWYIGLF